MSVIALKSNMFGCTMGLGAFDGLCTAFSDTKRTTSSLHDALSTLKSKIDVAATAASVDTSQTHAQQAETRECMKKSSLTLAYEKLDVLISDTGRLDQKASSKISSREDDFYKRYYYLKPECKKSKKEKRHDKWAERWQNFKDFWSGVGNAIANLAKDVVDFCKEHWKEILVGLAFIVVGALITVFTAGAGTAFWAAFGAALLKGVATAAISAVISGAINAACTYSQCRKAGLSPELSLKYAGKAFGDGAATGFMLGGIGFGVGSAVNAGAVALVGKTNLLVAHSFWGAVGRSAIFGATTNSITCTATSAIGYWIENGTLRGSEKALLFSAGFGALTGGVLGGYAGGKQYRFYENLDASFNAENLARTQSGEQSATRQGGKINQGDNYAEYANYRQETTHPNQQLGKEITVKNDDIASSVSSGKSTRIDQTLSNSNGEIVKGFELKSSDIAPYQQGQKNYFADNGGKLVADSTVTGAKSIGQVGQQTLSAGVEISTVRPSNFTEQIGVRLDSVFQPISTVKPFESGTGINNSNFLDVLSTLQDSSRFVQVTKSVITDITSAESILNSGIITNTP